MTQDMWLKRVLKPGLLVLALVPAAWLAWNAAHGALGANPIETITHRTGDWTLRLLLITLAVTPVRRITGWHLLIRLRRMLGLFAFFYASLHFTTYVVLDQFFDIPAILEDVVKRPYISVGFASFVLLVPLAITSTRNMVRRLGGKRWQRLHRLVYLSAVGGVLHYAWLVKADLREPLLYGLILGLLLGYRVWHALRQPASARRIIRVFPA